MDRKFIMRKNGLCEISQIILDWVQMQGYAILLRNYVLNLFL